MFSLYTFLIDGTPWGAVNPRMRVGFFSGQRKEELTMEKRFLWPIDLVAEEAGRCRGSETKVWKRLPEGAFLSRAMAAAKRLCRENSSAEPWIACLSRVLNRRFLWLLLGAYVAAAMWPRAGLWIRGVSFGELSVFGSRVALTLPLALLALLLANAGLVVRTESLRRLRHSLLLLAAGLAANLIVPLVLLFAMTQVLRGCTDAVELQQLLIGLTLVVAMPVAGSSAAWSQNGGGDVSLSLGLVLGSTLLSPFTTPLALRAASHMTAGNGSEILLELAGETNAFLLAGVVVPSVLGLCGHRLLREERIQPLRSPLGLVNALVLLTLCYANAAVSLPHAIAYPDWNYLAWVMALVVILCALMFAAGWGLARLLRAGDAHKFALMYGLGMNNNGTGLVLAATVLASHSEVLLPLILYNLVQHLAAGCVKSAVRPAPSPSPNREGA
jgi:BASS family bile acid:Na+ symporter